MPYKQDLDQVIFTKSIEIDNTRLTVSVYSYNNGPRKLQITRENKDKKDVYHYVKLGRLSRQEVEAIIPIIEEARKNME